MITKVTQKNMVTIPARIAQQYGIKPGYRLEWMALKDDQLLVRVIPDWRSLALRLLGRGRQRAPERDAVAELIAERAQEG